MSDQNNKDWVVLHSNNNHVAVSSDTHGNVSIWRSESADHILSLLNADTKPELPAEVVELLEYLDKFSIDPITDNMVEKCTHLLKPKLKPCPFCGGAAEAYGPSSNGYVRCAGEDCFMSRNGVRQDIWERRAGDVEVGS